MSNTTSLSLASKRIMALLDEGSFVEIGGAMVGLLLSEGYHTITFRYENRAFSLGWKISLACLAVFLILCWMNYTPKSSKPRGRYEKR